MNEDKADTARMAQEKREQTNASAVNQMSWWDRLNSLTERLGGLPGDKQLDVIERAAIRMERLESRAAATCSKCASWRRITEGPLPDPTKPWGICGFTHDRIFAEVSGNVPDGIGDLWTMPDFSCVEFMPRVQDAASIPWDAIASPDSERRAAPTTQLPVGGQRA